MTDHYSVERPSYTERGAGFGLTREGMMRFWDLYLSDKSEGAHPYASPMRARDFSRLPKAYVVTGEYDLLRDEGEDYACALGKAGVQVDFKRYHDMNHGFLNWVGLVDRSTEAMDALAVWMRQSL